MPPLKSFKKEKFARLLATTGISQAEAYRKSYNEHTTNASSAVSAVRLLKHDSIRNRISELLDEAGCTDKVISKRLNVLTKANKVHFDSGIKYQIPDNTVRLGAVQTVLKLKGHLQENQVNVANITAEIDSETIETLNEILQARKSKLTGLA